MREIGGVLGVGRLFASGILLERAGKGVGETLI